MYTFFLQTYSLYHASVHFLLSKNENCGRVKGDEKYRTNLTSKLKFLKIRGISKIWKYFIRSYASFIAQTKLSNKFGKEIFANPVPVCN